MRSGIIALLFAWSCDTGFNKAIDDGVEPVIDADGDADGAEDEDLDGDEDADADADVDADVDADADADGEPEPQPYDLLVDPPEIDFGTVAAAGSVDEIVHITNVGTEAVHLNGLGSSDSGTFSFVTDFSVPATLTPGMEKTMIVTFSPTSEGTYLGEITFITEEVLAEDVDLSLTGEGVSADCDICGPVIATTTSGPTDTQLRLTSIFGCTESEIVTVHNEGDEDLEVTGVSVVNDPIATCGNFSASFSPTTLSPGSSTGVLVTYTAISWCIDEFDLTGEWNKLHISSNDPSSPIWTIDLAADVGCVL